MTTPFGHRLAAAMDQRGPLCVGIDPHADLLHVWGLSDDPSGLRQFSLRALEAVAGHVAAVKPQSAFFERHGSAGVAVLEEVLAAARDLGVLSVLDVKRGDIGSTMAGYAQAYLADGAPLTADAITLSPFLGVGSLAPAFDLAETTGRGVFVLALTSNPQGPSVQHARTAEGGSIAGDVVAEVTRRNAGARVLGSAGVVVGATVGAAPAQLGLDLAAARGPILAPGVGAQGAGAADLAAVFSGAEGAVLATTSRGVLTAGPRAESLRIAAASAARVVTRALRGS